ncbi:SAVMC3_10250 family protein [Streptomyces sp. NPDC007251]|uniref:SAVMC3_10250 family protein n=1 Tax=Streptomyces sp. NPDC007251 TaxID=3154483 RepID=UPI0033D985DC
MRDLLYLSESKMGVLVPQLPGRVRDRLGLEAGLNAGVLSLKASMASDSRTSLVGALDAALKMIERKYGHRQRTEAGLAVGHWIEFDEEFRFGSAWPGGDGVRGHPVVEGLVYFAAAQYPERPPFVLVGSAAHLLDRRRPTGDGTSDGQQVGHYYVEAIRAYARALQELPGHAAIGYLPELGATDRALSAVTLLCEREAPHTEGWTPPVRLAGVARILAVDNSGSILATPLYIEYASR